MSAAATAPAEPTLLANLLRFVHVLRRAGLAVSPGQAAAFAHAVDLVGIERRGDVRHVGRTTLVNQQRDLALFDAAFDRFFGVRREGGGAGRRHRAPSPARRRPGAPFAVTAFLAQQARQGDPELQVADRRGTASDLELLRSKDFAELTEEERASVRRLIQRLQWTVSLRRTRRRVADPRGDTVHLRRALRQASRHGGAVLQLPRSRPKVKPRPLVLIADVSGSMERYARVVLQFLYGVGRSLSGVESFVFATRLTRITTELRTRNVDRALEEATRRAADWSGGTRIGACLASFNRRWGRRVLRRGSVVVVVSDGWERGSPELLRAAVRRLSLTCHRLIWLNPLAGREGYRPAVAGMQAALPFVDDLLPAHNLSSLGDLARHLATLPPRRRGAGSHDHRRPADRTMGRMR